MNISLLITEIMLLAGLVGLLWLLKFQTDQISARLQAVESVLRKVDERLPDALPAPAPPSEVVAEADVQGFVDDFYRDLDLLSALGLDTSEVDADGSYPQPTAEELAALDAQIADERYFPRD
jgi:hypothetical protein